jgi:hypothetical protein
MIFFQQSCFCFCVVPLSILILSDEGCSRFLRKLGDDGLKRYRVAVTFGFFALLLTTAAAFSRAPVSWSDASGFGTTSRHQEAALSDTHQGLVIQNANSCASNLSRINPSSPHGIVPKSIVPALSGTHGSGVVDILPISAREIGFHLLLRAPPVFLLI